VDDADGSEDLRELRQWVEREAPDEEREGLDHVPGLLTQLTRETLPRPEIRVAKKPIDDLAFEDVELLDYDSHPGLRFAVAE
jgi:thymidylate synthase